jgi:hypothetical protein
MTPGRNRNSFMHPIPKPVIARMARFPSKIYEHKYLYYKHASIHETVKWTV